MHYKDNPGGSIPTWLINWAAKVTLCFSFFLSIKRFSMILKKNGLNFFFFLNVKKYVKESTSKIII